MLEIDDLVYCSNDEKLYGESELAAFRKFLVSEVKGLSWFLRMQIGRDVIKIEISQKSYLEKKLENSGESDSKTGSTPAKQKVHISSVDWGTSKGRKKEKETKRCNCRGSIGSLNYLANTSRPDINFVVRSLSKFVQNNGRQR